MANHLASPNIADSFYVSDNLISLKKKALDKDFLFQANLITLRDAIQFSGKKSRVVYFSKKRNKVFMLESLAGNMVSHDYAAQLPLMEFDILSETEDEVTLDFNKGLSVLYYTGDWFTHDSGIKNYEKEQPVSKVAISYIDSASLEQNENLVIKQIARFETDYPIRLSSNVEVRYYLSPYHPDPFFQPTESNNVERFGYFEANPIFRDGGEIRVNATKWNQNKPIVYAISSNTPREYRDAVRRGVLYWNRILGGNHISVIDAPAGVTAPDFYYNVIQWVNFDEAGYAYADAQMDPRSGEILHAQVYLTSVFSLSSREKIRAALRKISKKAESKEMNIGLKGFEDNESCQVQNSDILNQFASLLYNPSMTDERILQVSQDYIASVVAHEVGHTLGLRHNFAGSLWLNVSLDEQKKIFDQYLNTGVPPKEYQASSSVMDYLDTEFFSMIGAGMRLDYGPLDYDKKAIEHLYLNKNFNSQEIPPFCTDSHVGDYADCDRFDLGNSIVDYAKYGVEKALKDIPAKILENIVRWKIKGKQHEESFMDSFAIPGVIAAGALAPQAPLLQMLRSRFQLIKIFRKHDSINFLNQSDVLREQDSYLKSEIEKYGGLEQILDFITVDRDTFINQQAGRVQELLDSGRYDQGVTVGEKEFSIDNSDRDNLLKYLKSYLGKIYDELVKLHMLSLSNIFNQLKKDSLLADMMVEYLGKKQEEVLFAEKPQKQVYEFILSKSDESALGPDEIRVPVLLPDYSNPLEIRMIATKFLKIDSSDDPTLGFVEKEKIKALFNKNEEEILKPLEKYKEGYELKQEKQNRDVLKWIIEYKKVKGAL